MFGRRERGFADKALDVESREVGLNNSFNSFEKQGCVQMAIDAMSG